MTGRHVFTLALTISLNSRDKTVPAIKRGKPFGVLPTLTLLTIQYSKISKGIVLWLWCVKSTWWDHKGHSRLYLAFREQSNLNLRPLLDFDQNNFISSLNPLMISRKVTSSHVQSVGKSLSQTLTDDSSLRNVCAQHAAWHLQRKWKWTQKKIKFTSLLHNKWSEPWMR